MVILFHVLKLFFPILQHDLDKVIFFQSNIVMVISFDDHDYHTLLIVICRVNDFDRLAYDPYLHLCCNLNNYYCDTLLFNDALVPYSFGFGALAYYHQTAFDESLDFHLATR